VIVEERIYTLQVGTAPQYLRLYEDEGLAIQEPILGHLVGYFSTELGPLNQIVHLWAYESFEERASRRARLGADERWKAYIEKVRPFVLRQENKILIPAPFSPLARVEVRR
jgi:hypothetical protein